MKNVEFIKISSFYKKENDKYIQKYKLKGIGEKVFNKIIDILDLLANISMICITVYIANRVEKNTKQQDKKYQKIIE